MKKKIALLLSTVMIFGSLHCTALANEGVSAQTDSVKNVILLIPDGQSVGGTTLARWYNGGKPLAVDEMACGLVRTYSSDAAIADSAPSGTAMATGFKSHTGFVGVLPDVNSMPGMKPLAKGDERKPIASILEAAQLAGKSTGIIATSEIMHATPADFTAHDPSRKNYDNLSEQQVYQDIDVVLGSGEKYFTKEVRGDGEDLVSEIKNLGYDYVTSIEEMNSSDSEKIWGMFAPVDMAYDFDRDPSKEEEIKAIKDTEAGSLNYTVGPIISKRANIGWTTTGHTGEDVPLYIYAPSNCEKLSGVVENTDIAKYMSRVMGIDLATATSKLFVPVRQEAEKLGATVLWDNTDSLNPNVVINIKGKEIVVPVNKNIAYVNGNKITLSGVTVFNGINTYVPQDILELIK